MNLVKMWEDITEKLVEEERTRQPEEINPLLEKLADIFDRKDVYEYKNSICVDPYFSPKQFAYMSMAIRRAFIEGYMLAQAERRKEDNSMLYNCYKQDIKEEKNEESNSKSILDSIIPRNSIN